MKAFQNKVAVITGAASGIGYAIAERCAQEGMRVVLADIEEPALALAEQTLKDAGAQTLAVRMDVSKPEEVEMLAQRTLETFGSVHLLFNNAGVGAGSTVWGSTLADWEWVMGVNLWGVIHGVRVFTPIMLAQDCDCHIVNTASAAGLLPYHPCSPYQTTKFAVVGLSENMYHSLSQANAKVGVSVLCPGWVKTRILESGRNRPAELQNPPGSLPLGPGQESVIARMEKAVETGLPPQAIADHVFDAIVNERFYILPHSGMEPEIEKRMEGILQHTMPATDYA
jgi:NAD(P)-dependent dehydrogenase (short-subunit alcohol dehydrogenase family)